MKEAMKIHWIYPSGPSIGAPETIGRHLAQILSRNHKVIQHAYDSKERLTPDADTILLGHPHPAWGTVFRTAAAKKGWRRVVMMGAFNGDPEQMAWIEPVLRDCHLWLAICGPWWFQRAKEIRFSAWLPRMRPLDLAVDRGEFPRVKRAWAQAGSRRFLYIGNTRPWKNTAYLSDFARARPGWSFASMGPIWRRIPGVRHLGYQNFATSAAQARVSSFDFMITPGRADANPTTILEAMAWGLIPVCTPQSGYSGQAGIVNIPLDDAPAALEILDRLQGMPEAELDRLRLLNDGELDRHYHWKRFASQVEAAILEDGPAPPMAQAGFPWRSTWLGTYSPLALHQLLVTGVPYALRAKAKTLEITAKRRVKKILRPDG